MTDHRRCCTEFAPGQWICRGPEMRDEKQEPEKVRWCFICRERTQYHWWLSIPVERSYYGPVPDRRCEKCGKDGSVGFGCSVSYGFEGDDD